MVRPFASLLCVVCFAAQSSSTFASTFPALEVFPSLTSNKVIRLAQLEETVIDLDPPQVDHIPSEAGIAGETQSISVRAVDAQGISSVTLMHRADSAGEYESVLMRRVAGSDNFIAAIDSAREQRVVEYYFLVIDTGGNKVLSGFPYKPFARALIPRPSVEPLPGNGTPVGGEAPAQTAKSTNVGNVSPNTGNGGSTGRVVLWAVLGLVVLGALASAGGGDSGSPATDTVPVILDIPLP